MKRLIPAIAVALTLTSCATGYYSATLVNNAAIYPAPTAGVVNISVQPSWGPAGYNYAMYYYFPDFNFYYDVDRALFYYLSSGRWVSAKMLPRGRNFPTDLHRYYKVVINERNPWNYNRQHKSKYKHYKGVYTQRNLRDERNHQNAPRRIQPPQHSTPSRNNNTMHPPQNTPYRDQGNVRPGGSPSNGNVRPGGGNSGNVKPGGGAPSNGNVKPGGGAPSNGNVKPSGGNTPPRGTAKPSGGGSKGNTPKGNVSSGSSSKGSSSKGTSSGSRSSGSKSSGSRSTGSRGR